MQTASQPKSRRWARAGAALMALGLLFTGTASVAMADGGDHGVDIDVTIPGDNDLGTEDLIIDDAQFTWGINPETNSGAFFGGCNFLSAGQAGDVGSSHVWTNDEGEEHYRTTSGNVSLRKLDAEGNWRTPSWETKCQDPHGRQVMSSDPAANHTETEVVIDGGVGSYDADSGELRVQWDGTFSVVYYGGMTYWWATDPVLELKEDSAGNLVGDVTATVSGFGADMYDTSKWIELDDSTVRLATFGQQSSSETFSRLVSDDGDLVGFQGRPDYEAVAINVQAGGPSGRQDRTQSDWGSFPQDFIDFQVETGQAAYWYTSGGLRDLAKPPSVMTVSFDSSKIVDDEPEPPAPPPAELNQPTQPGDDLITGSTPTLPGGSGSGRGTSGGSGGIVSGGQTLQPNSYEPLDLSGLLNALSHEHGTPADLADLAALETRYGQALEAQEVDWLGGGLIPDDLKDFVNQHREPFLYSLAGLLGLGALTVVAYRQGWLILPWKNNN